MRLDLRLSNAEVFDVTRFRVKVGEAFSLVADTGGLRWFTDNDPALRVVVTPSGDRADVVSDAAGEVQIRIFGDQDAEVKRLFVEVYTAEAVSADARLIGEEPRA